MSSGSKIVLIGKNSFLAQNFLRHSAIHQNIIAVSHDEIEGVSWDAVGCVVNLSYNTDCSSGSYQPMIDMDRQIADRLKNTDAHYVMFSSRMVYDAANAGPICEDDACVGQGFYGENKIISEHNITETLKGRYTILRLANIFGFEPGRHTFMGHALRTLREENRIHLDINRDAFRDFLPAAIFSRVLGDILLRKPCGIINLGSGIRHSVGDVAGWLIEGYGDGVITCEPTEPENSFVLNVEKLTNIFGPICSDGDIKRACIELGQRLHHD